MGDLAGIYSHSTGKTKYIHKGKCSVYPYEPLTDPSQLHKSSHFQILHKRGQFISPPRKCQMFQECVVLLIISLT